MEMNSLAGFSYQATLKATTPSPGHLHLAAGRPPGALLRRLHRQRGDRRRRPLQLHLDRRYGQSRVFWMGLLALVLCLYWTLRRRDGSPSSSSSGSSSTGSCFWSWPSRILFTNSKALPFTCLALAYRLHPVIHTPRAR